MRDADSIIKRAIKIPGRLFRERLYRTVHTVAQLWGRERQC